MKQLYFFDTEGNIYFSTPYVESYNTLGLEVPDGKRLVSIDTTQTPPVPIFEDLPVNGNEEIGELKQRLESLELALAEALGGV